jgi:Immunity protein 50
MAVPVELEKIPGVTKLHDWFGYWPDFHDAEVVSLHLNRKGNSFLRVHTWDTTKELDEKGYYVQAKHIVVEFILESVSDLCLNDFSGQNVISGLGIEKTSSGFRLELGACYGLAGTIDAERISLQITPGKPS